MAVISGSGRKAVFVSLPFTSLQYPNLGASLLAGALRNGGIHSHVEYLAFDFAKDIGVENYLFLSHESFYQALLGEWIFAGLVFDRDEATDMAYLSEVLPDFAEPLEAAILTHAALEARRAAKTFIADAAQKIAAQRPDIVGITSSFQQNMASLAFAESLKAVAPEITIIMGGANCEAELGRHLLEQFNSLDAVCTTEGDLALPRFVAALQAGKPLPQVQGILTRADPDPKEQGEMVTALDELPVPDFDDFYDQFNRTPGLSELVRPAPTIETSRGCWWGAKHHCTFCGLNGNGMAFRSKSPERAHQEFQTQARKYGSDFVVVDNILDYSYFKTLLPMLRDDPTPYLMHYEVKSNLFPKHVSALANAGIRKIQPGIETLDSDILKRMKKGVTAIQNIQTLKLCAEAGIFVDWGFIFGFPGEDPDSYDRMAKIMPLLHHLQPPAAFGPVRADRFSPYFNDPKRYGITLSPAKPYKYIYAGRDEDLDKFCYHFDMNGAGLDGLQDYTQAARASVTTWQKRHEVSELRLCHDSNARAVVLDSRTGDKTEILLNDLALRILEASHTITTLQRLQDSLSPLYSIDEVERVVEYLKEGGLLFTEDTLVLSLPLRVSAQGDQFSWRLDREIAPKSHETAVQQS